MLRPLVYTCLLTLSSQSMLAQEQVTRKVPAENNQSSPQIEKCELGHATPVHKYGNVYLSGQPTEQDLPLLKADGMRTIINLRPNKELSWDEGAAVNRAGMKYVHVPFRGEDELTSKVFDQVLGVLGDKESGPMLLHCGGADRVGAIWYAHRVLNDKLDPVEAELEAKKVGSAHRGVSRESERVFEGSESEEERCSRGQRIVAPYPTESVYLDCGQTSF